jgi:hypothetical protein
MCNRLECKHSQLQSANDNNFLCWTELINLHACQTKHSPPVQILYLFLLIYLFVIFLGAYCGDFVRRDVFSAAILSSGCAMNSRSFHVYIAGNSFNFIIPKAKYPFCPLSVLVTCLLFTCSLDSRGASRGLAKWQQRCVENYNVISDED